MLGDWARKVRDLEAAKAVVEILRATMSRPPSQITLLERETFARLRDGHQSQALRYLFQAERRTASHLRQDPATPVQINKIGIVGAGTMGTGIAASFVSAGFAVVLNDSSSAALERARRRISTILDRSMQTGRMSPSECEQAKSSLQTCLDYSSFEDCDLLIEAAFEQLDVKQDIFRDLARVAKPDCLFATNTSYLDVDLIAQAGQRADRSLGLHFFSPANIMRLLEVVRGEGTCPATLATAISLAKKLRKVAVIANNAPGFIGNRMFSVRKRETDALLAAGIAPEAIDNALQEFGFAMGPCRVSDLTGLDLGWTQEMSTGATIRERLCEAGRMGEKAGAGFYDYDEAGKPRPSEAAKAIIAGFASDHGFEQHDFSPEQIRGRLIWPMVDEAAILLDEGVAMRESDIDLVWVHGYGWPAWTGGPMFHARQHGLGKVIDELEAMGNPPSQALIAWVNSSAN